ncbi:MAG: hypothetical protein J6I68_15165 [Butyrivibrio sp.]|nr:hypothetical protein [Butyrivibrio sp.]MBP3784584.1 hypothetical protein [Butyrivibrio sp.]
MGKTIILLAILFLLTVITDWMQFRDELRDMKDDEEYDELYGRKEDSEME